MEPQSSNQDHIETSDPLPSISSGDERDILPDDRRRICAGGCERPTNVCLCDNIPSEPLVTQTRVVVLQHPHEHRHRLATVPVLAKCLRNCDIVVGRRLRLGDSPLLDSLYNAALENPSEPLGAIYLFPGTKALPSIEINEWKSRFDCGYMGSYVLIAFDGTWKHAREMVHASLPFVSKFAIQVCLKYDVAVDGGTIFNSNLILRKEPFSGCMSTMEAVARCLGVLESNGDDIEMKLVEVLRAMVQLQAMFLKPMKARPRLLKKVRNRTEGVEKDSTPLFGSPDWSRCVIKFNWPVNQHSTRLVPLIIPTDRTRL